MKSSAMQITVEIPTEKVPFVMELFRNLPFLEIKARTDSLTGFREEWEALSSQLPQTEPDLSEQEIMDEIRTVRRERRRGSGPVGG